MKNKKYLKAAELVCTDIREIGDDYKLIISSRSCCLALASLNKSTIRFNELFKPDDCFVGDFYFDDKNKWRDKQSILARSLALLLMYEMGEK
jgi:hypothetical protein